VFATLIAALNELPMKVRLKRGSISAMDSVLLAAGAVLAAAAAAVHVYIFVLESVLWTHVDLEDLRAAEPGGRRDDEAARLQPGLL
jgi:hypothetical protein